MGVSGGRLHGSGCVKSQTLNSPEEGRILRKKPCVPEGVTGDTPADPTAGGVPGIRSDGPLPEPEPHEGRPASSSAYAAPTPVRCVTSHTRAANTRCRPTSARTRGPARRPVPTSSRPLSSAASANRLVRLRVRPRSRLVHRALRAVAPRVCAFLASLAICFIFYL